MNRLMIVIGMSLALCLSASAQIFSEDFNAYSGNQNATQVDSNLEVAFGGTLAGWTGSGAGAIHAVDLANTGGQSNPSNWAMMFFRDNVMTSSAIAANDGGASYQVSFSAGPAVYASAGQATTAADGLIIDVLRGATVIATHTHLPGTWAGSQALSADSFSYIGDGSGNVQIRVRTVNSGASRFGGAIDDIDVVLLPSPAPPFAFDFNAYSGSQNAGQVSTNLEVAHSGSIPEWTNSAGTGAVHAVDLANTVGQSNPSNWAIMFFNNNEITSKRLAANDAGTSYQVSFSIGPCVYANSGQATPADDGLIVEMLRNDDSVYASTIIYPGAWNHPTNANFSAGQTGSLSYTGDGSGDLRLHVRTVKVGTFGGAIDDISITAVAPAAISFDFNAFNGNQNASQLNTGLPVAFAGVTDEWLKSGSNALHAVQLSTPPDDWAPMLFRDNVLTSRVLAMNTLGQPYRLEFDFGPATYAVAGNSSNATDGLVVEILRADNSVLATDTFLPGAWTNPTNVNFSAGQTATFNYTGDGNGSIRIRVSCVNNADNRFGGGLDNMTLQALIGTVVRIR
jgi:hypothetical protein